MTREDAETSDAVDGAEGAAAGSEAAGSEAAGSAAAEAFVAWTEAGGQEEESADAGLADAVRECEAQAPAGRRRRYQWAALVLACGASVAAHAAVVIAALLVVAGLRYSAAGIPPTGGEVESGLTGLAGPGVADAPSSAVPAPDKPSVDPAEGLRAMRDAAASDAPALVPPAPAAPAPDVAPAESDDSFTPAAPALGPSSWDVALSLSLPGRKPPLPAAPVGPAGGAAPEGAAPGAVPQSSAAGSEAGGPAAHSSTPARVAARGGAGGRDRRSGRDERGLPVPEYPPESRRRGEQGLVELEVEVLTDGSVGAIRVIGSPKYPRLVTAAIAAARRGEFEPATVDGKPVRGKVAVPFRFVLE